MSMFVVKRDGRKQSVKYDKITSRIEKLSYGLDTQVSQKVTRRRISRRGCFQKGSALGREEETGLPHRYFNGSLRGDGPVRLRCDVVLGPIQLVRWIPGCPPNTVSCVTSHLLASDAPPPPHSMSTPP